MQEQSFSSRLIARLASLDVALAILLFLCLAAIPGTAIDNRHAYYGSLPFVVLLSLLAGSLLLCTVRRWRGLALGVLVVHAGILVTLAGFVVRELAGTVATINVYEGESAAKFYLPYRDVDVDLGFTLQVRKVATEYYPVPVKVGVVKDGEKHSLHILKTGEQFTVLGYRVVAERFTAHDRSLTLAVYADGRLLGRVDTAGNGDLPAGFPLGFKLVAFQDPQIRRSWLDLRLSAPNQPAVSGVSEINHPLSFQGFDFYYVQKAADEQGRIFAGIQIVKDPGRPLVFVGLIMAALGTLLAAYRRFHGAG